MYTLLPFQVFGLPCVAFCGGIKCEQSKYPIQDLVVVQALEACSKRCKHSHSPLLADTFVG